jgi:hypothetical protein
MTRKNRKSISAGMKAAWASKTKAGRKAWGAAISRGHRRNKRR